MITSLNQLDLNKTYSYSDYILWQFKERVELLKGQLFPIAAPNIVHQRISSNLHIKLGIYLANQQCDVFHAPIDVRLPLPTHRATKKKIDTVVQPDLCVVCDASKLDKQSCVGAPDLIVEILSPGNSKREMKDKFELYEEAGVLEYWIVDPEHKAVFLYTLDKNSNKYTTQLPALTDEDVLKSQVLEGLEVDLSTIFPEVK